jgi:twitching motility protein PilT
VVDRIVDVFPAQEKELVRTMLSASLVAVVSQRLLPAAAGGRVAAMEIMLGTTAVRNQIREGKVPQLPQTIELGRRAGMQTMTQAIQELAGAGRITRQTRDATLAALGGDDEGG